MVSPATPAQSNPHTSQAPPLASLASKLGVLVLASRDLASQSAVASNPVALSVTTVSMGLLGIRALIARRNLGGGGRSGSARKHKGENFDTPGSALRVYKDGTAVPLETNDTTQKTQKAASTQKKSSKAAQNSALATRLQNDNLKKRSVVVVDLPPLLVLKATAGPSAGKTYEADPYAGALVIGRGGPCEFALTNDPEVSTSHAEIDWNEEDRVWRIRDVGSLNGTKLNGAPLVSRGSEGGSPFFTILEGDVIELGTKTQVLVTLTSHEAQSSGFSLRHGVRPA